MGLSHFHGKHLHEVNWHRKESFRRLAQNGVFIPFADSFEHNGSAYLIVGGPDSGKTSVTGRFVGYNNHSSQRLSEDAGLNAFDDRMYAYQSGRQVTVDAEWRRAERFPIEGIFHLSYSLGEVKEGDLELALARMFYHSMGGKTEYEVVREVKPWMVNMTKHAYENVPVFLLPRGESPNECYRSLKKAIDTL
ncbi:MAG: hypothetical protein ABH879_10455 [archaeon]